MNEKIVNVFFDANCLPYKDKERQVHFPIVGGAFLGASNTTKIRFYFDYIGNVNTTWVAVAKLPNGKQGSKVLSVSEDTTLGENYAELELSNWYTQAKGDVYIALQGYQGGVEYSYDSETELYEIHGTPTIQTTGSIKLAINYAPIGQVADYTDEFTTYQEILAGLGDKADISSTIIVVNDITQVVATTYEDGQVFYNLADRKLYQLDNSSFVVFQPYVAISSEPIPQSDFDIILAHKEYPILYGSYVFWYYGEDTTALRYVRNDLDVSSNTFTTTKQQLIIFKNTREYDLLTQNAETYKKSKIDTELSGKADKSTTYTKNETDALLNEKQNTLVSGTNIKSLTVDGVEKSLLGSGTIEVGTGSGGGAWGEITGDIQDQTDLQNEFQDVREVAEGKCATYVLSYSKTAPTTDTQAQTYKKPDGTAFTNLSDFNTYVSGLTLKNSSFNSQNNSIIINYAYLIFNNNTVYKLSELVSGLKKGDIFLIGETDVPDRWVSGFSSSTAEYIYVELYKLETSKIDLTNYATTGDLSMARYETELLLAPEYNQFTTYAVGDKVVRSHKLYTCTTAITTPESWDSTHWTQVSVASGFVDLDKEQVITGGKTFNEVIKQASGIQVNSSSDLDIKGGNGSPLYRFTSAMLRPMSNNSKDLGSSTLAWKDLYLSGTAYVGTKVEANSVGTGSSITGVVQFTCNGTNIASINLQALYPSGNNAYTLGTTSRYWKALYTSAINPNSSNYGLTLPDTTNFTANKEIATTDQAFNVINASDIENNTLTQAQYNLITNGKPTLISGTLFGYDNMFITAITDESYSTRYLLFICNTGAYNIDFRFISLNTSTLVMTLGNLIRINSNGYPTIANKQFPTYPSSTGTFNIQCVNGTLAWNEQWYGTQAEYDALSSYDSNTTYYISES